MVERSEEDAYVKEVERRRTRINAGTQQEVQSEVGRDIWGASKVGLVKELLPLVNLTIHPASCFVRGHLESSKHIRRA